MDNSYNIVYNKIDKQNHIILIVQKGSFMLEERTSRILLTIIKHCNIIEDTKNHFGNNYKEFEENSIYQNAILTPVTQIGKLVKRLPSEFRKKYNEIP